MKKIFTKALNRTKITLLMLLIMLVVAQGIYSQNWSTFNGGVPGWSYATTVYNNHLYAGGEFGILEWNGAQWISLGTGVNGSVWALTVYNGKLIAGGFFTTAGGKPVNFIAQWDGVKWSGLEGGTDSYVVSLAVYNGELVAGGYFKHANIRANYIAKWDGHAWSTLSSGMGGTEGQVMALTIYGNSLIAAGFFTKAGGKSANHIAKWDGTAWSALGSGLSGIGYALTVYNGNLIAGGLFSGAGGVAANDIAKWNGASWSALGKGIGGGVTGMYLHLLFTTIILLLAAYLHMQEITALKMWQNGMIQHGVHSLPTWAAEEQLKQCTPLQPFRTILLLQAFSDQLMELVQAILVHIITPIRKIIFLWLLYLGIFHALKQ